MVVAETRLGGPQQVQRLGHHQEGARVVRVRDEKGGAGKGTGWPGGTVAATTGGTRSAVPEPAASASAGAVAAASACCRLARSRPYFLRNLCKATVETRSPQVRSMKSRVS